MEEDDDLMRLAKLALHANPVSRTLKPDPTYFKTKHGSPVRCICHKLNSTSSHYYTCSNCHCLLHKKCMIEIGETSIGKHWICPICKLDSSTVLKENDINPADMVQSYRQGCQLKKENFEILKSSTEQLEKASDWLNSIQNRNDVYENFMKLTQYSVSPSAAQKVHQEIENERIIIHTISDILQQMAEETKQNRSSLLTALEEQIATSEIY